MSSSGARQRSSLSTVDDCLPRVRGFGAHCFESIQSILGPEVLTDAARHNSCAHRVRAFWTNMVDAGQLQKAIDLTNRPADKIRRDCLEPNHRPNTTVRQEKTPFYRCNTAGAPMRVAPTFVSYRGLHAFRNKGPGKVQHTETGEWREPLPIVRERAMGSPNGTRRRLG